MIGAMQRAVDCAGREVTTIPDACVGIIVR